jgi:hypothetical protein
VPSSAYLLECRRKPALDALHIKIRVFMACLTSPIRERKGKINNRDVVEPGVTDSMTTIE